MATWCVTCGNEVREGKCVCWCLLADALQQYLGMDHDGSAQMASDLWQQEADKRRVWSAEYQQDHFRADGTPVPVYPAPAEVRERDARNSPHDEPCPRCGRRQWTDEAAQETCQSCGYVWSE